MTFSEALELLKQGRKVRRHSWHPEVYHFMNNSKGEWLSGHLMIHLPQGDSGASYFSEDIFSDDWEAVWPCGE